MGNFFQLAAPSLLISIIKNWTELQQNSRGSRIEFIFCMTMPDLTLQSRRVKNYWSSDGLQFHIHLILQTWLLQITTCTVLCLTIYARKNSTKRTISKSTSSASSAKSPRASTKAGSFLYLMNNVSFFVLVLFIFF